jgi:hypothetical protein
MILIATVCLFIQKTKEKYEIRIRILDGGFKAQGKTRDLRFFA